MKKMFKDYQEKRKEQFDQMTSRKGDEDFARRQQNRELTEKMNRSQAAVDAFKAKTAHQNMLTKELAKLKDDDMKKVHMRAKRLQTRKKNEIMTNEENTH